MFSFLDHLKPDTVGCGHLPYLPLRSLPAPSATLLPRMTSCWSESTKALAPSMPVYMRSGSAALDPGRSRQCPVVRRGFAFLRRLSVWFRARVGLDRRRTSHRTKSRTWCPTMKWKRRVVCVCPSCGAAFPCVLCDVGRTGVRIPMSLRMPALLNVCSARDHLRLHRQR